jgi:hypothetical protein
MPSAPSLIRDALFNLLSGNLDGACVHREHVGDDAFEPHELPAVVIDTGAFSMERVYGVNSYRWEGDFDFHIYARPNLSETPYDAALSLAARIVELIDEDMANPGGLGGMVTHMDASGLTPPEDVAPDTGGAVLTFRGRFETPARNWNAIIGPAGIVT